MKCKYCGTENEEYAKFCKSCGSSILESQTHNNTKRNIILAIVIVILLILISIGATFAYIVYYDTSEVEVIQLSSNYSGDVLNNNEIALNIPESNISREICDNAKSGVPMYKIGNGSGPVTVISAGVHGDQLVPTIAAMRMINYLDGRKIKGTVYIIPFSSPKAIQDNVKLTDGVNLNTVADENGTISNDIVNFAISHNASAVGDFHETEIGKNPGKTTIMCSQLPTYASYQLANNMSTLSLDTTMTYFIAGIAYDGAIEDELNLKGTPSVTPLVLVSTHGKVNQTAVTESYDQMLAILIVNGNLDYTDDYLKLANADIDGFDF